MAKISIDKAPTPSEELIKQAVKEDVVTAEDGRQIRLRKPGVLAQFKIVEAVGSEAASNQTYMQMVNPLIYVAAIDDEDVFLPTSKREVEALIQRLDETGLAAVFGWYMTNIVGPTQDAIAAAERAAHEKAQLKNS